MKVIEITVTLGTSCFTSKCSSASEAFDVVRDAYVGVHGVTMEPHEADEWMSILVQMRRGVALSREQRALRVRVVEVKEE